MSHGIIKAPIVCITVLYTNLKTPVIGVTPELGSLSVRFVTAHVVPIGK